MRRPPPIRREELTLHGHTVSYRTAGEGPVLVLIHGVAGTSETWEGVIPDLARERTVVAPDLLGHGQSAKPRGDYSLGAYASGLRDLLIALGHEHASFVGHSLGGGVAMQLAYQFPERCERLVLVSSGGLGREVHLMLRAATLPGSDLVLPLIFHPRVATAGEAVSRALNAVGLRAGPDVAEIARSYGSLCDASARQAFIHTLRSAVDPGGQRVSARDRLYLAAEMPTLIVWGERDPIIPARHGRRAHEEMPGSRLELLPDSGHFPHLDDPRRFVDALATFLDEAPAANLDPRTFRDALLAGGQG
jgi:pimeloyl-ACP methyl ester carboxylesterase